MQVPIGSIPGRRWWGLSHARPRSSAEEQRFSKPRGAGSSPAGAIERIWAEHLVTLLSPSHGPLAGDRVCICGGDGKVDMAVLKTAGLMAVWVRLPPAVLQTVSYLDFIRGCGEMVYAPGLGPGVRKGVEVRILSSACEIPPVVPEADIQQENACCCFPPCRTGRRPRRWNASDQRRLPQSD